MNNPVLIERENTSHKSIIIDDEESHVIIGSQCDRVIKLYCR